MAKKFERPQAGDPLTEEMLNAILDELERLGKISGDGSNVLIHDDETGIAIEANSDDCDQLYIKVTAVGADGYHYAFTQQIEDSGGGWVNGPLTGTTTTDPAQEFNGYAGAPLDSIYPAWIVGTSEVRFRSDHC